jgi:hypothetical protein
MRPMARGQTQHGGPPGWLEESDPAGVIFYVMNGPAVSVPCRLPGQELPSCELKKYQLLT